MLAESNLRKNHTYRLINYGEETVFEVREVLSLENYKIKNVLSLEILEFQDLVRYGTVSYTHLTLPTTSRV